MMNRQIHSEGSVRHAEKRRKGTCQFANRIARTSLDAYEASVPKSFRDSHRQTCVAAIVAHFYDKTTLEEIPSPSNDEHAYQDAKEKCSDFKQGHLQVMGLGVGTKFLPHALLKEEQSIGLTAASTEEQYGRRIRDCHAEVLARRAFRRQLAEEILSDLNSERTTKTNHKTGYNPILERVEFMETETSNSHSNGTPKKRIQYRLKPHVTLHFYASSAPCGNATLKKFIKMEKEIFDTTLGPDEWPQQEHEPVAAHSLRLGQFALLVKKDGSIQLSSGKNDQSCSNCIDTVPPSSNSDSNEISMPTKSSTTNETKHAPNSEQTQQSKNKRAKKHSKPWPCNENDTWCPPSCSITNFNKGTIHSCSDKLCRWNCLGLQGSLLMAVLESPLYMDTLTVGRKFSRAICQRAVCCRADGFGTRRRERKSDESGGSNWESKFRLNHPALMETCVYMDETGTHDMAGVKTIGQDASFDSNLCWVWWPGKSFDKSGSVETISNVYPADCISGKTGYVHKYEEGVHAESENQGPKPIWSEASTLALSRSNVEILIKVGLCEGSAPSANDSLTLEGLLSLKDKFSANYVTAKEELLGHRVFRQWSRRKTK